MIFSRKAIVTYKWVCIIAGIIYAVAAGIEVLQSYAETLQFSETRPQIYVSIFLKELVYSTMFIGTAILIELVERLVLRAQNLSLEELYK